MAMKVTEVIKKVCMLGDPAVGKTSLVHRFVFDLFDDKYLATIGTKIMKKTMVLQYPDNALEVRLTLLIWDITGHKKHMAIHPTYYEGAEGAFIVCDGTRQETMTSVKPWLDGLRTITGNIPTVLLVNKTDLLGSVAFNTQLMEKVAADCVAPYLKTSAKTGDSVEKAFTMLGDKLVHQIVESRSRNQ